MISKENLKAVSYLGPKTVSYFTLYSLLAKLELLPYPFSATRTSLHPLRSIRNLNGNPDKNVSNAGNLGYFRNLRVSETSVGAIILDSRILTTIRMRSLLQKTLWSGMHEIALVPSKGLNWQTQDPPLHHKLKDEQSGESWNFKFVKDFLPRDSVWDFSATAWVMRGQWRCLEREPGSACSSNISREPG